MVKRQVQAIAAGICVAIVAQESIWVALDLLDPSYSLNQLLAQGPLAEGWVVPLLSSWIAGGALGGLMATLVGGNRLIGHLTGLLLSGSALLVAALSFPGAGLFLTIAATPSIGAAPGSWLGLALARNHARHLTTPGVGTLRSGSG